MSIASMILGIVSVFFGWTFLVPIIGILLGIMGLRKEPGGKGFAITGVILTGLMLIGWLLIALVAGAGMGGLFALLFGAAVSAP